MRKFEEILRTYIIPVGATALVILFWQQYPCQGFWWFPYIVGAILFIYYFFYFWKLRNIARPE
jgi:hypothetical protein